MINKEFLKSLGLTDEVINAIITRESKEKSKEDFDRILHDTVKAFAPYDEETVLKLLDVKGLNLKDGQIEGLKERLDEFKEKYPFLFKNEKKPEIISSTKIPKGISAERFKKMSYKERAELYKKNQKLYTELLNA